MITIEEIAEFFSYPAGDERRIVELLGTVLEELDRRKEGSAVGVKPAVDYEQLMEQTFFPPTVSSEKRVLELLTTLYEGVTLWGHPDIQVNVIPPPTTLSIIAAALAARFNENSIWDHYGMSAARSEVMAVAMLSDLIGFDRKRAGGIFTFGGTGCNLYAARIGIEKCTPGAKYEGIRQAIHFFCSDVSHYSIKTAAIWTGVGIDNIKVIPSDDNCVMDMKELRRELEHSLESGARIGTIYATMGTTDAFALDPLEEIAALRDEIALKLDYRPHIHADAVIGWPYLTFKGDRALESLPRRLREELKIIIAGISQLKSADSVGIDFHKTGWAPYLTSVLIVKERQDLVLLEKLKRDTPYLYHDDGYQPGTFTLESSRPNYAQKALVNMLLLGKEGYETLITHLLSTADYLRERMEAGRKIAILNRFNPAFVTDFRVYPEGLYDSAGELLYEKEVHGLISDSFTERINRYNRELAHRMIEASERGEGTMISYTDSYKRAKDKRTIVALKSYPMSPFIRRENMDRLLESIVKAQAEVEADSKN